ncbi:YfjI family protein [Pseudomonas sp. GV071]|uniref:YfjI family protein n=1 Tax=Pseudomonas sp. GV071 TaxID=2135754 RepID=UPI000D3BF5B5|nr:YfjI family protein [Pseudomonas sp. GV071]PTQ70331.1 uncharacterized protein DUF3987 [Pseudomonas sp. GV071]
MKHSDNDAKESNHDESHAHQDSWPSFHEKSLTEAAVTEAARELQVSREMALMCAFGAMATACQKHVDVVMPTGHKVPTSLMLLTIADSGERKTTTQNNFFEAINRLNDAAHSANESASIEHRVEHQLWNTHKRHLERMYSKCAAEAQDEAAMQAALKAIAEHVRLEPQPARSSKFLYEDTTPQALVHMLYENEPNGCLLTSEANGIFSGKALGELDKLNTLWDGNSVIVDRISREGFVLQNARLTLSLMAQPSVVSRFMGKRGEEARGTGFLARFLVVKPRAMAGRRTDRKLTELPRRLAFNIRVRECLESAALPKRQLLSFSEQAKDLWFNYSRYLEKQMQEDGLYHYLKDHASKLLENTSRLAAILHTFERDSDSDTEIDYATLKFCWEFSQNCSSHFIKYLASEPQIVTDANLLAHYLLTTAHKEDPLQNRNQGEKTLNDLMSGAAIRLSLTKIKQNGPSSLRGRANSERLDAAIEILRKLGHIAREGRYCRFSESILLKEGEPELKNGQIITIRELPLFSEQVYERQENSSNGSRGVAGYFIKVR